MKNVLKILGNFVLKTIKKRVGLKKNLRFHLEACRYLGGGVVISELDQLGGCLLPT